MADKPEYRELLRCLVILRYLQIESGNKLTLMDHVCSELGRDIYAEQSDLAAKQFSKDIGRLRAWGIDIVVETGHHYRLVSFGQFNPICLSESDLSAVAFLAEAFAPGAPEAEAVQRLLLRILDWVPIKQRSAVSRIRQRLRIDLRRADDDLVDPAVETAVNKAHDERRRLRFKYLSPGQADGVPREHMVEPWYLYYDTISRHVYLRAYRLSVTGPHGTWAQPRWQDYRLVRILADGIMVLPDKLPPEPPKRHFYAVQYLLAPDIVRLGQISRHFTDMEVHDSGEDGWVRVTATTDDLFRTVRLLLGYGARCRVLGGPELRRAIETDVAALAIYYKLPS
jgi:predicted DNA-binding transcriptional regulator YafY